MNAILTKILAMGLAIAQVTTRPDAVKTEFDPTKDQAEIVTLLRDGCAHLRKAFDIEAVNLDDLIATAMNDPQALNSQIEALHGLNLGDLLKVYGQFCKDSTETPSDADLRELALFYNETLAGLPDHSKLKEEVMRGQTVVLDGKGEHFATMGDPERQRIWVPLSDVPEFVQNAFIAAEDKRFYQHTAADEHGLIRALVGNLAEPGRPQGGSSITQQVAKNLLVGGDVTFERKIREMVVASRIERAYTKPEILAIYLNSIYFGRSAWGIEMAARNYFNKPAKELTLAEGALLAALIKGPGYFNPDRYPKRAHERVNYVLQRMVEDGIIVPEQMQQALAQAPILIDYNPLRRDTGFYFIDHVGHEAKDLAGIESLTQSSYTVRSTLEPDVQLAVEIALQEGLARYERESNRLKFDAPEVNLSAAIQRIEGKHSLDAKQEPGEGPEGTRGEEQLPAWLLALRAARLPLYDVHWSPVVIVEAPGDKRNGNIRVGLSDGRILPLQVPNRTIRGALTLYDVVFAQVEDDKKVGARAELRVRPTVQGAAVVLDNRTGKILATTGGFSYPLSQLNRTTQAWRQPGSALKPVTYLAALKAGLGPQSIVYDTPITLAPIDGSKKGDYWTPKNYGGGASGRITLEQALERSRNLATVHLLDGGIAGTPKESLDRVCEIAREVKLYEKCEPFFPFVLGAQPLRVIDLAAFYAGIANGGVRPSPYVVESIAQQDRVIYRHEPALVPIGPPDAGRFFQLKSMLQGVVARGTATSLRALAPYVAGKTGTTDDSADTWFVGFSNDVTVAVWVGYDNADGARRSLGDATGNRVAAPIFGAIMQAVWATYASRTALAPPSKEMKLQLAALATEERPEVTVVTVQHASKPKAKLRVRRSQSTFATDSARQRPRWRSDGPSFFKSILDNVWGDRLN
jgi:penicillin-binding protein 1A